jgi:hypothetical protein
MVVFGPSVGQVNRTTMYHLEHMLKTFRNLYIFDASNEITKRAFDLPVDLSSRSDLFNVLHSNVLLQVPHHRYDVLQVPLGCNARNCGQGQEAVQWKLQGSWEAT